MLFGGGGIGGGRPPDTGGVVLLDIDLPGPDGLQAARQIKSWLPGARVIMLSEVDGEASRGRPQARCGCLPTEGYPRLGNRFSNPAWPASDLTRTGRPG